MHTLDNDIIIKFYTKSYIFKGQDKTYNRKKINNIFTRKFEKLYTHLTHTYILES